MNRRLSAVPRLAVSLVAAAQISHATISCSQAQPGEDSRWWSHVRALASDDLRGRRTGTEDFRRAAAYVAAAYRD
ncbi:MAG TPA: hypothetical protein VHU20_06205, partial [Candidatus Eisenbacteria bacterium]|nr:hypothetical protein [Candidatus Eisenbacteria bacterium]